MLGYSIFRSYFDYDDEDSRTMVISTSFWLASAFGLVMAASAWLLAAPIASVLFVNTNVNALTQVFSLQLAVSVVFLSCMCLPTQGVYQARKWSKRYSLVAILAALVEATTSVYLVVWRDMGVIGVMLGTLAGGLFRTGVLVHFIRESIQFRFSTSEASKMILYGLPMLPERIFMVLNRMVAPFFLSRTAQSSQDDLLDTQTGMAKAGIFSVSMRFAQLVNILLYSPFLLAPVSYTHLRAHET